MPKIKHIDLFSGIGGFALAADRVFGEVEHIFCDNEPFAQEVLKKHWPNSKIYGDIRTLTNAHRAGNRTPEGDINEDRKTSDERWEEQPQSQFGGQIDILTGGFPCQPFSQAGRRKGTEDDRYLWPEMLRVIREFEPTWVIAENVRGLLSQGGGVVFEQVCTDLESAGYEVQPIVIPAVAVNAPHRRDRVWFVAHCNADCDGRVGRAQEEHAAESGESAFNDSQGRYTNAPNAKGVDEERRDDGQREAQFRRSDWGKNWHEVATTLCRVDDGVPRRLDRNPRLKALGNAIVPQVAEEIMKAIKNATRQN